jgi:hypothetical protein
MVSVDVVPDISNVVVELNPTVTDVVSGGKLNVVSAVSVRGGKI